MPEADRPLRVFLCHASQDKPAVRELYQCLKKEGWIDPWLDEEKLTFGQHWTTVIEDALHEADIVILFLSRNSVQKEGFVQRELNYAWEISLEKPRHVIFLIPFRLDDCEIPRYLSSRQWGDYFGEKKESTYQILLRSLRQRYEQKLHLEAEERARLDAEEKRRKEAEELKRKQDEEAKEKVRLDNLEKERLEAEEKKRQQAEIEKARHEVENLSHAQQEITKLVLETGNRKETKEPDQGNTEESTRLKAVVNWRLPDVENVLEVGLIPEDNDEFIQQRARLIQETLASFGAPVQVVEINRGPAITQFGVEPLFVETRSGRTKVRVNKIASLADDLALALAAPRIRVQAPVPGHSYVGIEVPNDEMTLVALRDIVESESFQKNTNPMKFALGRDVTGHPVSTTLENMPHLLIAGTTGSGKSVCVNSILACMLLHNTPDELKLVLVDPKRVELTVYNGIPHLLSPVIVEVERVIGALQWTTREMDRRYHLFAQAGSRNINDYNAKIKLQGGKKLPLLVIVINELADLMMISPTETEQTITRLAQLARATGIHMVLATQRPSVDVVTGLIKANFPARIAFAVASNTDSRVILDQPGAERLLGRGDMLFQAPDAPAPVRLQGVFVSDHEIQSLIDFWRAQLRSNVSHDAKSNPADTSKSDVLLKNTPMFDDVVTEETSIDPLFAEAVDLVRKEGRASVSIVQRRLRIGYARAARLVDMMEDRGIVGPPEEGTQIRKILDSISKLPKA